jgi:hypothetical protein
MCGSSQSGLHPCLNIASGKRSFCGPRHTLFRMQHRVPVDLKPMGTSSVTAAVTVRMTMSENVTNDGKSFSKHYIQ